MTARFLPSAVFICLLLAVTAEGSAYPSLNGYVTDLAGVLDSQEISTLTTILSGIEKATTAEIAILIVNDLDGQDMESYAVGTFESSGLGKADIDNGLLLIVAVEDRKYRLEVGYGLEPIITDIASRRIGVDILSPYFKKGQYGLGLIEAARSIGAKLEGDDEIVSGLPNSAPIMGSSPLIRILANLFPLVVFFIIISSFMRRNGSRAGSNLLFMPLFFPGFGSGFHSGGFGGGLSGGGFGGFGGGMSGGGGFSGGW